MKFGQLFGQNIKSEIFFLKNNTQNMMDKLFQDPFLKNKN